MERKCPICGGSMGARDIVCAGCRERIEQHDPDVGLTEEELEEYLEGEPGPLREFLAEQLHAISLVNQGLANLRDMFYTYRDRIPPDLFGEISMEKLPFLRPDRGRLLMPEGDKIVSAALIREVFDDRGQPDGEKFATAFSGIQSKEAPLTRFGAARRWRQETWPNPRSRRPSTRWRGRNPTPASRASAPGLPRRSCPKRSRSPAAASPPSMKGTSTRLNL